MQREVVLIFGQTGTGKTTHAKKILQTCSRALVIEADFGEFPALQFQEYDEMLNYLESQKTFSNFNTRPYQLCHKAFRVAYSPRTNEHELLFHTAYELGNLHLILDEADRFDDPRYNEQYDEVITRGRHYGVNVVACGLHIFKLPKELRRQATRIIAMRQIDRTDLDALAEIVGLDAYKLGPGDDGKFSIEEFAYLEWTRQGGTRFFGLRDKSKSPGNPGPSVESPEIPDESSQKENKDLTNPQSSAIIETEE